MNGILVVDKPPGITSHDVVDAVRRSAGTRSVGHAGTLDPFATGVLVVAVGNATRFLQFLKTDPKEYLAEMGFGIRTDTDDATGRPLEERDAAALTREDIEKSLEAFKGKISQVPPAYAAIKVKGEALYKAARRGEEVERTPREVVVYELVLEDFTPGSRPVAQVKVVCSAGTYIRALARDIGERAGVGGTLQSLRRTRSGVFAVEEGLAMDEAREPHLLEEKLISLKEALGHMPSVSLGGKGKAAVLNGRPLTNGEIDSYDEFTEGELVTVAIDDELLAVARASVSSGEMSRLSKDATIARPVKVISHWKLNAEG
ncbi:MAG: tRNA pseudouridine(55) synthase TruB [Candidatus Aquicultorales bacterium]